MDEEEEAPARNSRANPASAAAKPKDPTEERVKAKAKGPTEGRVSLSSLESTSEEIDPPRRVGAGRKKVKNPSSSESEAPAGPGKGKGKKGKGQVRCQYCWTKVSSGKQCLQQHQFWNANCIAWQYYQRGVQWGVAKEKAQKKKEKREQQAWDRNQEEALGASAPVATAKTHRKKHRTAEKKKPRKSRASRHSPEVHRERRRRDPSTDSEGGEEKQPKVRRQDDRTFVIRLPKA